jgi:hypothetical protein
MFGLAAVEVEEQKTAASVFSATFPGYQKSFQTGAGLPDFFDTIYQSGEKYAKLSQHYQMTIC